MDRTQTCLCFFTRTDAAGRAHVLLGRKKTGLGAGKVVGLGGKVEADESAVQAAVREVAEESGLAVEPADLRPAAIVDFRFPARPAWDQWVTVFVTPRATGDPHETDEIAPAWFPVDRLPLTEMWDDARHWLPQVLAGRTVEADIVFADDCDTVASATVRAASLRPAQGTPPPGR
jgi:8-oxo-dGTP diphosphatase